MQSKIKDLLKRDYSGLDLVLQSHFLNYICVLVSGYLEKEMQEILDKYKKTSHFNVHECKKDIQSMRKIQNAKWCSVRPTLTNIDKGIVQRLNRLKDFDFIVSSIDNIVKTRHQIAHGENVTHLNITVLKKDFKNIQKFLNSLNKIFSDF